MEDRDQLEVIAIENGIYYPSMAAFGGDGIVFDVGGVDYKVAFDWKSVRYDVVPEMTGNRAPQERARYRLYDANRNEFDFIDLSHDYDGSIEWLNDLLDQREEAGAPAPAAESEEKLEERSEEFEDDFVFPDDIEDEIEDSEEPENNEEHEEFEELGEFDEFDDFAEPRAPEPQADPYEYEEEYEPAPPPRRKRRPVRPSFKKPRSRKLHRGIDYKELRREREIWEERVLTPALREERRRRSARRRR